MLFVNLGFCNQNSLSKELVLKRDKDELELDVIKEIMAACTYNKKKHFSNEEVGRVMVELLGKKKIDDSVLEELRKMLNDRPSWVNFVNCMLGFDSVGTFAKELSMFWTLYKALQHSHSVDWKHNGVITPTCAMYLIDRLALQASLWSQGDYLYATKSTVVEWILNENIDKYSNIPPNSLNHLSRGLQLMNAFPSNFLDSYTIHPRGQKNRMRWIDDTKGDSNVQDTETDLVVWLTAAKCLLHINCGFKNSGGIHWLLQNEGIKKKLPLKLFDTLSKGFVEKNIKEVELVAISDALKLLENPLVIVELKRSYKKTNNAPSSAILLNFETWQDRSNLWKELFPFEVDQQIKSEKRKGIEKPSLNNKMKGSEAGCSSEVEQIKREKMKGPEEASSKKTDFSWLDIVTKFDLDNGKSERAKLDLMRY